LHGDTAGIKSNIFYVESEYNQRMFLLDVHEFHAVRLSLSSPMPPYATILQHRDAALRGSWWVARMPELIRCVCPGFRLLDIEKEL
jgi:hypothetical protein